MAFDKDLYRKRRSEGLRGQGDKPVPKRTNDNFSDHPGYAKPLSKYAIRKHTKRARKAEEHGL